MENNNDKPILNMNIVKPSERLNFGVVDNEFINIYSPDNRLKVAGDFVFFLFTNTVDFHIPLIGYGEIKYDRYSADMLKIYGIELHDIYENPNVVNRYFNYKNFEMLSLSNVSKKIYLRMKNEFLDKNNNRILSDKVFNINSFFVRDNLNDITDLRYQYCRIIHSDIEQQYMEINKLIDDGSTLNPHKFLP